jgi:hypothetical protein
MLLLYLHFPITNYKLDRSRFRLYQISVQSDLDHTVHIGFLRCGAVIGFETLRRLDFTRLSWLKTRFGKRPVNNRRLYRSNIMDSTTRNRICDGNVNVDRSLARLHSDFELPSINRSVPSLHWSQSRDTHTWLTTPRHCSPPASFIGRFQFRFGQCRKSDFGQGLVT